MTVKAGDIVQLKSGGPLMTISGEKNTQVVECCWFKDSELKTADFMKISLEKYREPDIGF